MPVLTPPPAPGQEQEAEELPFEQIREHVRRNGEIESVQILKQETRSHLSRIKASWPGDWSYD